MGGKVIDYGKMCEFILTKIKEEFSYKLKLKVGELGAEIIRKKLYYSQCLSGVGLDDTCKN